MSCKVTLNVSNLTDEIDHELYSGKKGINNSLIRKQNGHFQLVRWATIVRVCVSALMGRSACRLPSVETSETVHYIPAVECCKGSSPPLEASM